MHRHCETIFNVPVNLQLYLEYLRNFSAKLCDRPVMQLYTLLQHTSEQWTQATPASNCALSVELSERQLHVKQRYASKHQHQNVGYQKRTFQSQNSQESLTALNSNVITYSLCMLGVNFSAHYILQK